jgi:DNA-directed RNA polymerase subunit K/omega
MSDKIINTSAETIDTRGLEEETDNIYLSVNIISKRANQMTTKLKEEIKNRLEPYESDGDSLEEIHENREQMEISLMYERQPKPTLQATHELLEGGIYWKLPENDGSELPEG